MRISMFASVMSLAFFASAADAGSKRLSLGEVGFLPTQAAVSMTTLRGTVESEMGDLDLRGSHKDAILSVSVVKLESDRTSATCVISATLRSRDGGVLFAVLEGRARAQGASDHIPESALRGAVHGALSRVPDALK